MSVSLARCKNAEGGPSDGESHLPRLMEQEKGNGPKKVIAKKKRKRGDADAETVAAVETAAEHAERGGRGSGIRIGDQLSPA